MSAAVVLEAMGRHPATSEVWRGMAEEGRWPRCLLPSRAVVGVCPLCGGADALHNLRVGCPTSHPWQREYRDPETYRDADAEWMRERAG